jgi:hypothetical protein
MWRHHVAVRQGERADLHGRDELLPRVRRHDEPPQDESGRVQAAWSPAAHQRIGNQVSVPPFMSGTSRVLPSSMIEMSAADWNLSDRSLGGSLSETSS